MEDTGYGQYALRHSLLQGVRSKTLLQSWEVYRCYTKLNHPNGCAGPSSYSAELINDAVLKEIRRFLGVIKAIPQENLLEKAREKHDGVNEVA